jgi:hypothetical protein
MPWLLAPALALAHEDLPGVEHHHDAVDVHDVLAGAAALLILFGALALIHRLKRKGR